MRIAEIIYDDGTDLSLIQSKKVAIIGYGSQGHTYVPDLKDSGVDVVAGLYPDSSSWVKAGATDPEVKDMAGAVAEGGVVSALLSDQVQRYVYTEQIAPSLKGGATLLFAYGFSIRYGHIETLEGHDVVIVTPKGPGHKVRETYAQDKGTLDVVAVEVGVPGRAWDLILSYAKAIGDTHASVIKTTFTEETETDLFGRQAALCSDVSHLIQASLETLAGVGYQPEIAYLEVCREMKQIVDLINEGGIIKQRWPCFDIAEYGDYVSGPRVINESSKEAMEAVLADIQDDTFARKFIVDQGNDALELEAPCVGEEVHPIEGTGQKLCKALGWTDSDEDYTEDSTAR